MKIFLYLFLVSGINYVSCFMSTLSRDIHDIAAIVPIQDLFQIFNPNKFDSSSHKASDYVSSTEFQNSMYLIFNHPDMKALKQYLDLNSIDINEIFLKIIEEKEKSNRKSIEPIGRRTIKLQKFVERAYSVSQMDNIVSLVIHKTATSVSFRNLYSIINSLDHNRIYGDMINVPKVKDMVISLNQVGINTMEIWRAISYLFGWDKVTNIISLEEYEIEEENRDQQESPLFQILRQYLNLIPKEKFIFLYRGLLVNPLFQEITTYIFNKQYHKIVQTFDKNPLIGQFFDYLESQGVSFLKLLDLMRDRLGFTYAFHRIPTGKYEENSHSIPLVQFFELVRQILPLHEIKNLTATMLKSSSEYREFRDKVLNLVYNSHIELFFKNQVEIQKYAVQYGCTINKILNFVFSLIGIEYHIPMKGKEFTDSIYEFVDLFPKADYIQLYDKYKNDTNIWKMVTYLKGSKFADFIGALFSTVELKMFVNFLSRQYVPFKVILVDILDRLGIMQWWINYEYFCGHDGRECMGHIDPNSDNLYNFVKERINLFPLKEILILFHNKLQNNHYFQNLYLILSKMDGANLFKKITEHDVLRDFFVKMTKIGYNIRAIVQQFSQLFGWGNVLTVDLSLNQTIENFDNLLYRKELFKILHKYPAEVQQIVEFFKNSAFINSMYVVANEPVIRNIITWMQNLNVPVMNYFNYYSGQDTPNVYHLKLDTELKWKKMSAEIVKFLNKNKFFDFSVTQKYNSIEFHAFLEKVLYVDFNFLTEQLSNHPETHYVVDKLLSTEINFQDVYDFVKDVKNYATELP